MATTVYANTGNILRVNLSTGTIQKEDATPYYKTWLGGRALAHYLLFKEIDVAKTDPLSPQNMMIISSGVLGGTAFPSSGRTQATFLSPLNLSGWGDANCGGHFGPALKRCGFDMIIITGKAPHPVFIDIQNGRATIEPAKELWGKGTIDTQAELIHRLGEAAKLLCIGPAGENLIPFANVRTESTSSMGRTGAGAVFGSKNLKAVVARGTLPIRIFKPKEFLQVCKTLHEDLMNPNYGKVHSLTYKFGSQYGTPGFTNLIASTGMVPIRNWQRCGIDPKFDNLVTPWYDAHGTRREACHACPVHCHAAYAVRDGKYPTRGGGPEYETFVAFGHKCDVTDEKVAMKLNTMCNDYGLDTVSMGAVFSTLMELRERGIVDQDYTDGVDLVFGNGDAMVELMPKVVYREGCGRQLALGPYKMAEKLGKEALKSVYHQKGMCATGVETRSTIGAMLSFAVSPRGAHHLSGLPTAEWVNVPPIAVHIAGYKEAGDIRSYHPKGKANLVQYYENMFFMSDSLGICKFNYGHLGFWHDDPKQLESMYDRMLKAIYYASGIQYTKKEIWKIFEKAYQIERATIALRGLRRKDDQPNYKCLTQSCPGDHPAGPVPLPPIDSVKYNKVLDAYYEVRGWDLATGIPKPSHLKKLGLPEVAEKIAAL